MENPFLLSQLFFVYFFLFCFILSRSSENLLTYLLIVTDKEAARKNLSSNVKCSFIKRIIVQFIFIVKSLSCAFL